MHMLIRSMHLALQQMRPPVTLLGCVMDVLCFGAGAA
jgi:hypothetical protein